MDSAGLFTSTVGAPSSASTLAKADSTACSLATSTFVERGGELRLHHGGCHRVDADARAELDRELGGDVREHRLARAIEADDGRRLEACHRRHIDDRTTCSPIQARCACCPQDRAARQFTSTILRAASRSRSTSAPYAGLIPLLFTSRSTLPNASMVALMVPT